jgi:chemotaxis protein MotA
MNISSVLGILLGTLLLVVAIAYNTGDPYVFWNLPGLAIVIGGTLAATLFSYPIHEVIRAFKDVGIVLKNERVYTRGDLHEIVEISRYWFAGNIAMVERRLQHIQNQFLQNGVQMVVDGAPIEDIREFMQWRIDKLKAKETVESQMYRSMAMYAPAFGMLGTLFGLVSMMQSMGGADIELIGKNMGFALVTTFYGIMFSNLVFKPIAIKLERRTERRLMQMNVLMEGVILLVLKRSPSFIDIYLDSYIADYEDELSRNTVRGVLGMERRADQEAGG